MARAKSSCRPSARDRILATASELFYQEGIQSVGIDRIIAESGVAKMSLYNHFKSKDGLIAAWLEMQGQCWRDWFEETLEGLTRDPRERVLAIFDVLAQWFEQPGFRGCAFINTSVELVDPEHPGYAVIVAHQQAIADYVLSLVQAAELPHQGVLAQQLLILVEGAIVVATMQKNPAAALQARQVAAALINGAR